MSEHGFTGCGKTHDTTCVPSAEADSEKETNGLDAGLKASTTRNHAPSIFSATFSAVPNPMMNDLGLSL
jgi:hypothetical protein